MKSRRFFSLLLALLLLTGCKTPAPPAQPETPPASSSENSAEAAPPAPAQEEDVSTQEPETPEPNAASNLPEALPVYVYSDDTHSIAVTPDGQTILETKDGKMEPLADAKTGQLVALLVHREEGFQTDSYGNTTAKRQWSDLYDLSGQFKVSLPLTNANVYGDYLYCFSAEGGTGKLYSLSGGYLLYDDVSMFSPLGENYFVSQGVWGNPGVILDSGAQEVARTPVSCTVNNVLNHEYLVISQNGLSGLLDSTGQELLPCQYADIYVRGGSPSYVHVQLDDHYEIIDPTSGDVLFRWDSPILYTFSESLVAQMDTAGNYMLLRYDGTPLMEEDFLWVSITAYDEDETPTMLCGTRTSNGSTQSIYFHPDGTVAKEVAGGSGDGQLLSENTMLITSSQWDDTRQVNTTSVRLLDLQTGETRFAETGENLIAQPMYTDIPGHTSAEPGYFLLAAPDQNDQLRFRVVNESGRVILEDCRNLIYRGGGVVQCTKDFTQGLLRLDGQWIYEESSFDSLN